MAGYSLGSNRVKNMSSPPGVVGCPRGGYSSVKLRPFQTLYGCWLRYHGKATRSRTLLAFMVPWATLGFCAPPDRMRYTHCIRYSSVVLDWTPLLNSICSVCVVICSLHVMQTCCTTYQSGSID